MKKVILELIICIGIYYVFFCCRDNIYAAINSKDYLKVSVPSAVVIDNETHRVLFEKDAHEKRSIASLTKMMTCIMLTENCELDEIIEVPDSAAWIGGSELGLKKGDTISVYNLLVGMLLPSGNDCAYTAGIHVGGTIENFAKMMTEKAKQIGALNTSFKNAHGLDEEEHYSTAYDMAIITSYALKNETINKIIQSESLTVKYGKTVKTINNTNRLLRTYEYCDGGKTGYTSNADRCLIATASKDDFRIITVVLGATNTDIRFNTGKELLKSTFEKYKVENISDIMNFYIKIPLTKGEKSYYEKNISSSLLYPLVEGEIEDIYIKQNFVNGITAPCEKGSYIGNIKVYIGDEEIYSEDIYLDENIEKKNIYSYLRDIFNITAKKINRLDIIL